MHTLFPRTAALGLLAFLVAACMGGGSAPVSERSATLSSGAPVASGSSGEFASASDEPLQVVSATPKGQLQSVRGQPAISVTFSRPMAALGDAPPPPRDVLTIDPAVPGSLRWEGTRTLVFRPDESLSPATNFDVTLASTITDQNGHSLAEPYAWSFQTPRPRLVSSAPADGAQFVAPDSSVHLSFNLPVRALSARAFLEATFPIGSVENNGDSTLVVVPQEPLEKGASHAVTVKKGLRSRGHELGLKTRQTVNFCAYPRPDLVELGQPDTSADAKLFDPGRDVTLTFSTPVRVESLRNALSVEPSVEWDVRPQRRSSGATRHVLSAPLKSNTQYTLTIKGLEDRFGQRLPRADTTLRTGASAPRLRMEEGIRVVEASQRRALPVGAVNVDSVRLGMERLSADEIVPAIQAYTPKTRNEPERDSSRWEPVAATRTHDLPIDRNTWTTVPLRLDSLLTDGHGVVGVRLLRPESDRDDPDLRAIAQVTRLGVTGNFSASQNLILVTDLARGEPIEGATVTIRDDSNTVRWRGTTDARGRVRTPGWRELGIEETRRFLGPNQYVIVKHEGDVAFTSSRTPEIWGGGDGEAKKGVAFSDRGLYRPGETVHLKGILRTSADAGWQSLRDSVRLLVRGPMDDVLLDRRLQPSDWGTIHLNWSIPDGAALGDYSVWVGQPGDTPLKIERYARFEHIARGNFQVDAVRRAAFTVNAQASRDSYVAGDVFGGHVSAHYLHDAKMAGLPVTHTLSRNATSYSPPGYDGFQFGAVGSSGVSDSTLHRTETVLDSTGRIDAPRVRLPGTAEGFPTEVAWKATVTSPSRQRIWDQATATLHPGRFYVGLKPSASVVDLSEDSTLAVEVVTVDPEGTPVAGKTVTVDVVRRPHRNDEQAETVVRSVTVTTDSSGTRMLRTALPEGGRYHLEATSRDGRGNIIRTETYLYASGGATAWQRAGVHHRVEVEPARTRVAPGETAQLMIKSPYEEATALITIEREGILESRVTTFTGQDPTIDLPITEDYIPNATVKILLLKGRTTPPENASDPGAPGFKIGQASLLVDPDRKRLQVEIEPNRSTYRPGEKVTADLRLTNAEGEGVPGEIAFSAADAGILNRIDYQLPDPFKTFYAPREAGVTTSESRAGLVAQDFTMERPYGSRARHQHAKQTTGRRARQQSKIRSKIRPLAHWAPAVQTNADGRATVSFTLPENVSTLRLMATALTEQQFGAAQTDIVVTKPLVLKPALPRFARIGDQFEAGVLVTNRSDEAGTVTVSASAQGLTLRNDTAKTVQLSPGATREVRFDWTAPTAGDARVTFRAGLNGETDALAATLPVKRPTTKRTDATFASTSDTARTAIRLASDRTSGLGQLKVTLSSTVLTGLDGAVQHLLNYPYNCLEQRTSRVRPLLAGNDLLETFELEALDGRSREQVVRNWLLSLQKFWRVGGFTLWQEGNHVDPYVTAYVLATLAEAKEAGYDLPQPLTRSTIDAGADLIQDGSDRPDYYPKAVWRDTRAFMLFALARHGRVLEKELRQLAHSPPAGVTGQSYLLRTLSMVDRPALGDAQNRLVERLRRRVRVEATTAYLKAPEEDAHDRIFSSDVRATAFGLTALLKAAPSADFRPTARRMIRYLMEQRRQGHWASTQDNAAVLTAFQAYVDAYEQAAPDLSGGVQLAGTNILESALRGRSLEAASTSVETDVLPSDREVPLAVGASGTGRLYYSARLTTYTSVPKEALNQGLRVERRIRRLNDQGEAVGSPVRTSAGPVSLEAGTRVKVSLRLYSPTDRSYVVVDDALPTGLEPVNGSFATSNQDLLENADPGASRRQGSFTHAEMHDDRVVLFADRLRRGTHTYSYVARATTPGTFAYPPAEAEMMYQPETHGHTATSTLVVGPVPEPTAKR